MAEDKYLDLFFDDLPDAGVFSGVCTLIGGIFGAAIVAYNYWIGVHGVIQFDAYLIGAILIGLVFAFLTAAFTFLIGWIIEIVWPLLLIIVLVSLMIAGIIIFYFGYDNFAGLIGTALSYFYSA